MIFLECQEERTSPRDSFKEWLWVLKVNVNVNEILSRQFCDVGPLYSLYICTEFKKLFVPIASLVLPTWLCKVFFPRGTSFGTATTSAFILSRFVAQDRNFSYATKRIIPWTTTKAVYGSQVASLEHGFLC